MVYLLAYAAGLGLVVLCVSSSLLLGWLQRSRHTDLTQRYWLLMEIELGGAMSVGVAIIGTALFLIMEHVGFLVAIGASAPMIVPGLLIDRWAYRAQDRYRVPVPEPRE